MTTSPPLCLWAIPCLTAFSTNGWRRSGGSRDIAQPRRDVDGDAQPMLKARLLDIEVRLDDVQFASERREFAFGSEHAPQQGRQTHQRLQRARRRRLDQVSDRRERIEQEMRIELRAERAQLGLRRQLADFLLAKSAIVPLGRDPDGVDATRHDHGDRFQRGEVVRQEPTASAQLADREGETWLIGRRDRDPRGRRRRKRFASRASDETPSSHFPPITTAPSAPS